MESGHTGVNGPRMENLRGLNGQERAHWARRHQKPSTMWSFLPTQANLAGHFNPRRVLRRKWEEGRENSCKLKRLFSGTSHFYKDERKLCNLPKILLWEPDKKHCPAPLVSVPVSHTTAGDKQALSRSIRTACLDLSPRTGRKSPQGHTSSSQHVGQRLASILTSLSHYDPSNLGNYVYCMMFPPSMISNSEFGTRAQELRQASWNMAGLCDRKAWETRVPLPHSNSLCHLA